MSGAVLAAAAALAAVSSWAIVAVVRDAARRRGLLDVPNARSSHARPTPRLGGLGIVVGVVAGVALAVGLGVEASRLLPVVGIGLCVAAVSLADDLRGLPALVRLAVHAAAAAGVVWSVGGFDVVAIAGEPVWSGTGFAMSSPPLAALVTGAWIVGFVNAFNFMDGIDGIAAGQAAVAGAAWAAIGWWQGEPALAALGVALAAACAGFLPHNWSPASIFMGDVGSAWLGFLIAAAPLVTRPPRALLLPAALAVWPFVFDTTLTILRRAAHGENLLAAHRSHLYQRLTQAGWSHGAVAALYTGLAAGGAILAVRGAISGAVGPGALALVALAAATLWGLVVLVERQQTRGVAGPLEESPRA